MADLTAQGPERADRWRRQLRASNPIILGREEGTWSVPWDNRVSRKHARLQWNGQALQVEALPNRPNPIFFRGEPHDHFRAEVGDRFVIGSTSFTISADAVNVTIDLPRPASQQTFSAQHLRQVAFRHARQQIEALSRLPEIVAGAVNDQELCVRLVNLVLTGITSAHAVAVVRGALAAEPVKVLHWDHTESRHSSFQPSGQLIEASLEQQEGILHLWDRSSEATPYTIDEECDWAFCIPVPGTSCDRWAIYVAGQAGATNLRPDDFQDYLKFVQLVATTVGNVCDLRLLQRRTTSLSSFFSPPVRDALAVSDPEVALAPREANVSVLFCDLRGFSRESERSSDDLFDLLNRVGGSLGIMTRKILDYGGVIGDFHGDSAMGFWGWPISQGDDVIPACRTALEIRSEFEAAASDRHAMSGFRAGIGIATGQAVAGKIGTVDQVKVTVFGPVVNVAARLEGMTRRFGSAILVDGQTAEAIERITPQDSLATRRLGNFRPYGMASTVSVHQLMTAADLAATDIPTSHSGIDAFADGDWKRAAELFHELPQSDPVRNFFLAYLQQHNGDVPEQWDGIVELDSK